jgi:hypothetical protein
MREILMSVKEFELAKLLNKHLDGDLKLKDVAKRAGLSK